jgi:hypothetical protein
LSEIIVLHTPNWQNKSNKACDTVMAAHTKSGIIWYSTPSEPFQVWQIDLYGPLPMSQRAQLYIFCPIDMFSKFVYNVPLLLVKWKFWSRAENYFEWRIFCWRVNRCVYGKSDSWQDIIPLFAFLNVTITMIMS